MTKYDSEVDLSIGTSTGIILNKIPSGSTVLEFGCAAGRMTRYMKNALDCRVYIVEYDKEAFDIAMQYAADGVCDDILTLSWMEKFKGIEFDSIIFADVLEHLSQPDVALFNASKMLKEQGRIYISIPNVAHNDVLLKAFNNHFDYTRVGILDDTHVHFWGYENLFFFASSNGLHIHDIEITYCPTGQTEQYQGEDIPCSPILMNYFNERKYAEAYQFVVVLGKESKEDDENIGDKVNGRPNSITGHLYVDDGNGFNEQKVLAFQSENTGAGRYVAHYVVTDTSRIKKLRFDPVELQGCILQNLSVRQNGKELAHVCSECLMLENGILMAGTDPMVFVDIASDDGAVTIDADIVVPGDEYLGMLQKDCFNKQSELEVLRQEINAERENTNSLSIQNQNLRIQNKGFLEEINTLNVQNGNLRGEIDTLSKQNEGLREEISNLNIQNESSNREISSLNVQNGSLCTDLGTYIILTNKKDELLIDQEKQLKEKKEAIEKIGGQLREKEELLEKIGGQLKEKEELLERVSRQLKEKEELLEETYTQLKGRDRCIINLEEEVNHYKNRKCIRILNLRWRIFDAIKRRLKRLIRK